MKKAFLVFLSGLLFAAFVARPAVAEVTFNLGIKGGVSFAKTALLQEGERQPISDSITRPVLGAFLAVNFNRTFAFQPEVFFLVQGGAWEWDVDGSVFTGEHRLTYIHVPLLAKIHLIQEGKMIPIIFAGPAVAYLMSAREPLWIDGVLESNDNVTEYFKRLNFSAVFGGGFEFTLDKLMIALEVRYDWGLVNTVKDPAPGYSLKSRALMIMAGFGF